MNLVLEFLEKSKVYLGESTLPITPENQKKLEEHPHHHLYVKHYAAEHKAGRDRNGKKAAMFGVTKDHIKAYNASQKSLKEDVAPTNVVSSGAIATKEVPLGTVAKRKPLDEVTDIDATEAEKLLFKQKQDQSNQTG